MRYFCLFLFIYYFFWCLAFVKLGHTLEHPALSSFTLSLIEHATRMTALIKWSVPREWGPVLILFMPHTMLSAQWVFNVWWISELKVSGEIKARGLFPWQKLSKPPLQLCLLSAAILIRCHLLSVLFCSLPIVCFFYLPFWSYFLFLLWPKLNKKSW